MTYEEQKKALIQDLKGKLFREDWHGVSDAANDLRVLEAQYASERTRVEITGKPGSITLVDLE